MQQNRLQSLDIFRGITIAAMILVNNLGSWDSVYRPLLHADWRGCTLADLVFPFFLFIVGVSIAYSLRGIKANVEQHRSAILQILKRSAIIFLLGLLLNALPYFDFSTLRIPGVLQRIAIVFLITAILFLKTTTKTQMTLCIVILIVYYLALSFIPVPDIGTENLVRGSNLAAWIDYQLLASHLWKISKTWDPEGILTTVSAIASCLIGLLIGQALQKSKSVTFKIRRWLLCGGALIVLGFLWNIDFPLNKNLWTSSYVLFTAGLAIIILAGLYYLVDVRQRGQKCLLIFKIFGVNAIFIYMLSMMIAIALMTITLDQSALQEILFNSLLLIISNPFLASLLYAMIFLLIMYLPVRILYKRNIIMKI